MDICDNLINCIDNIYQSNNLNPYIANITINKSDFNKNSISNIIQKLKKDFNIIIKAKQNNYDYIIRRNNIDYKFSPYYNNENNIYGIRISII